MTLVDSSETAPEAGERPGLMVVHGHRAEQLLALALTWTQRWPQPPLQPETWIVPSQAVALWVKQTQASQREGVAAGLEMLLPAQWLWRAYRAVLGGDAVGEFAPLDEGPLTWRLWRLLPTLDDAVYAPLQRYLRDDPDGRRRYQLAHRLADLYDQYQVYRGDWLQDWASGAAVLRRPEGAPLAMTDTDRWQAALWQRVLADCRAGADPAPTRPWPSRVEIHAAFVRALQHPDTPRPPDWPRRLTVFGLAALPPPTLEALALAARWTQVLVCVLNPCRTYWADVIPERVWLERAERHWRERAGAVPSQPAPAMASIPIGHPLLAAWGRQGRDTIALLQQYDERPVRDAFDAALRALGQRIDLFDTDDTVPDTQRDTTTPHAPSLLRQLQDDVLHNRTLAETQALWPPVDPARDGSLRFHVCHTALREVEVLHDQIVAALHRDPSLQPRDIVVMAPDVATYAPLIHAVFGRFAPDDPRHVPYTVADAGDADSAQLLALVRGLLDLPRQRLSVNTVLDWLQVPAFARRFGWAPDDLPLLRRWLADSGVRWGLDGAHRQALGAAAEASDALTWTDGLHRLWLGMALGSGDSDWRDQPPAPGVSPMLAPLIERLQALLQTLQRHRRALADPAPARAWVERLGQLLDDCLLADASTEANTWRLLQRLRQALHAWAEAAQAAHDEPLPLVAVADAWLARVDAEAGAARGFLGGGITVATLLPMRAVPFRRVYLLGMHDGAYPRRPAADDFDLMARHPRAGDRLPRHEDLYLFLEALLSAREHLSISWVGHSAHDGSERAPCVLVGQLRDHLAAGWRSPCGDGASLVDALTTHHRLHPFDRAYFAPRARPDQPPTLDERWFSYASEWAPVPHTADLPPPSGAARARATATAMSPTAHAGLTPPPSTVAMPENAAHALPAGNTASTADSASSSLPRWQPAGPLSLATLLRFVRHPVRTLYEDRLDVRWRELDDTLEERDLAAPDGLQRWQLDAAWLRAVVQAAREGQSWEQALQAAQRIWQRAAALGRWPAGLWGEAQAGDWQSSARTAWQRATAFWHHTAGQSVERDVLDWSHPDPDIPLRWLDVVGEVRRDARGHRHRLLWQGHALIEKKKNGNRGSNGQSGTARLAHALPAWITHLAHHRAGGPLYTWVLSPRGVAVLQPLEPTAAQAAWQTFIDLYWHGMHEPSRFQPISAHAWYQKRRSDGPEAAWTEACKAYEGGHHSGERDKDALLRRSFPTFADLAGERAQAADSAFGAMAERVFGPLHAALAWSLPPDVADLGADASTTADTAA